MIKIGQFNEDVCLFSSQDCFHQTVWFERALGGFTLHFHFITTDSSSQKPLVLSALVSQHMQQDAKQLDTLAGYM